MIKVKTFTKRLLQGTANRFVLEDEFSEVLGSFKVSRALTKSKKLAKKSYKEQLYQCNLGNRCSSKHKV